MTDRPNIFDRALALARMGYHTQDVIKQLKSERYESVEEHLSPSVRRQLTKARATRGG